MTKILLTGIFAVVSTGAFAQSAMGEIDGVPVINDCFGQKISRSGAWVIAETFAGGSVVYNTETGAMPIYYDGDYGRGQVVSENGWVVGCVLIDDMATQAVIMADGKQWTPPVFDPNLSSNIHSITPDGSRCCGNIGADGSGYMYKPFYCDIDANGNFSAPQILPFPDTDFYGSRPQYSSAVWLSSDGKTIAGQVIDARGAFVYPIVYTQGSDGNWTYSLPSEKLFNPNGLPIPPPLGDIDDEYPDAPYPELQNFMTPAQYQKWEEALLEWELHNFAAAYDPYSRLDEFMSLENVQKYYDAVDKYNAAVEEYNEKNFAYWDEMYKIADESLFFVRNAMALSADGKWLAMTAQVDDVSDPENPVGHYVPYVCNLQTQEWKRIGKRSNLLTSQVLPGGVCVVRTPAGGAGDNTYLYYAKTDEFISLYDYLGIENPQYQNWFHEALTGDVVVGEDEDGNPIWGNDVMTVGCAAISENFETISGGVSGYEYGYNMYFTYIFKDLKSGVESISADEPHDGIYRVYNLQGVKMLETKDLNELKGLEKGVYIVNRKKVML